MPNNQNKLSQFWQELKRRKVTRTITVYTAAAFVILELVSIIVEPLRLPDWTLQFTIVFLCIGFIIAVILSWIYDIHPERGIVKTEPEDKIKEEDVSKSSNSWKIASYISFVVIVGLIALNILPRANNKKILDKSIAVLPFRNDSPDQERMYFINGTMEAILDNLCKIEDLRVPGRTSVEQYRDNPKPIPVVAEEMNVSYVLEGSGHRDGDNVRLFVQLLDGRNDHHLWSKSYDADIEEIFSMQSEIAQLVAAEIAAVITPEEKQLIDKVPTTSLAAYDFYQQGKDEHIHYGLDNDNRAALERAEVLFKEALVYDSTFTLAYTGLARIYWDKHFWEAFFAESFLDSVLILAEKAISIDPKLSDAYSVKGDYYRVKGQYEQAIIEYDQAIKLNPNDWIAYLGSGRTYTDSDMVKALDNMHKAAYLHRGPELPMLLRIIGSYYGQAGFNDKFEYYQLEALKLDRDSAIYFTNMAMSQGFHENYQLGIEYGERALDIDSTNPQTLETLGDNYDFLGQSDIALQFYQKWLQRLKELGQLKTNMMHRVAYVYWLGGFEEEAQIYFDEQIEYDTRMNELGRSKAQSKYTYYDLAGVYAFRGEKIKAYENLRIFNQRQIMHYWTIYFVKNDPLFDSIRDEPEFQQIVRDVESKYQAEHERVRQWLEENDML